MVAWQREYQTSSWLIVATMLRGTAGNNWIVQKLIDRDHINHHYRRLDEAQSHLQLNKHAVRGRLSKSSTDLRYDERHHCIEKQMSSQFSLDVTVAADDSNKKKVIFDESLDVINRHSKYFTQPKQLFTPRVVRKIVRPSTAAAPARRRLTSPSRPTTANSQQLKSSARTLDSTNNGYSSNKRNVSDDSAFGDEHDSSSVGSSSSMSDELTAFDFKKWLREQEEENSYMKLMCDITADLLQRHLCTNGNMKEIITLHIRKSRRKFSVGANVLMRRLCDDLLIPMDESFDDKFYGSRYSSPYPMQKTALEDFNGVSFMKTEKPNARVAFDDRRTSFFEEPARQKHGGQETRRSSSSLKSPLVLALERPVLGDGEEEDAPVSPKDRSPVVSVPTSTKVEIDVGKVPDVDGYFSDFTNDTENDIEEQFDFDY